MNDWQLLQEYAARRSETAFRELTERHLNLVYSAALRQVNDPQLAEEICQSVFILLARKAGDLKPGIVLAGWLFRTTRFVAARARRGELRRQRREQEAFEMHQLVAPDQIWPRLAPVLDEALDQLGETDRQALLLRFFEDKSLRETGEALGLREDAARKRVDRALERLRAIFGRRGCIISAAALGSALAARAVNAAPTGLATTVARSACLAGSATPAALPSLVRETLSAWRWARIKLAVALTLGVVALVILLSPGKSAKPVRAASDTQQPSTGLAASRPRRASPALAAGNAARPQKPAQSILFLHVIARDTGEPVDSAQLALNTVVNGEWRQHYDLVTDAHGIAEVAYPAGTTRLDVGVLTWGWGVRHATWVPANQDPIPGEYTLSVDRVTNSMGGWLRDAQDRPVAQAEIILNFPGPGDFSNQEMPRERFGLMGASQPVVARTDAQGWWTCAAIPAANHGPFQLTARHPDFRPARIIYAPPRTSSEGEDSQALQQLWEGKMVTRMEAGLTVKGRVLDEFGGPITDALVSHEPYSTEALSVSTDANGNFAFNGLEAGDFDFAVSAPGFSPQYRQVSVQETDEPVQVRLKPGALLRLRLVDSQGQPVAAAKVGLEQWGEHRQKLKWSSESDADGRITWTSAPVAEELELYAVKDGWCYSRELRFKADGNEHQVVMQRVLEIAGLVTDATTGRPISNVKAFPGYGQGADAWQRIATRHGKDGGFVVRFEEQQNPWRVRVEAEGYTAFESEPLPPDFSGTLKITLRPAAR